MYMKCYPIYKEDIIYNNFLNLLDWRFLFHTVIHSAPLTVPKYGSSIAKSASIWQDPLWQWLNLDTIKEPYKDWAEYFRS